MHSSAVSNNHRPKDLSKLELHIGSGRQNSSSKLGNPILLLSMQLIIFFVSLLWLQPMTKVLGQNHTTTSKPPNYLETGRQITGILDRFMSLGYDKRVRPNYGGPPVEVNVTMRILSISSVSEVMMDFTADFYFRQTWHDPRLAFKKLGDIQTLYVGAEVSKKIWLPDTFFGNEKLAYFHEATTPNVFLRIDHSGEVYRSIRLTVTSSCPMNLQYFPMDRQRCTIEAESYGYNVKDIIYRWARKETAVERDKEISLPQFDIVKTVQKYRLEELSSGTYSRLIAEIHFARRMGYYLIQIYIPSSLIVVISWVSFWLHRNASPARVQLGVTTVLTMTTLMSSTNAALPKISYVKSIDIFLGTCFVMVFAALLEYATVGYLGKRIAMRKAQVQHAQSQLQARVFAQLQAQGAQGDPVPPITSSSMATTTNQQQQQSPHLSPLDASAVAAAAAAAASTADQQQQQALMEQLLLQAGGDLAAAAGGGAQRYNLATTAAAPATPPPQIPERLHCNHCNHNAISLAAAAANQQQLLHHQPGTTRDSTHCSHGQATSCGCTNCACSTLAHETTTIGRHHRKSCSCNRHHQQQHVHHLSTSSLPRSSCHHEKCLHEDFHPPATCQHHPACYHQDQPFNQYQYQDHHHDHQHHQHQHHDDHHQHQHQHPHQHPHQQQQHQQHHEQQPPSYCSKAAAVAAATFVNMHRKNKGLPPSSNPNFVQSAWQNLTQSSNRSLETIFGVRPSDIDKYSRVVFPVCFVCFQLMYWIVYLHISAFLETEYQQQQQQQLQPQLQQPQLSTPSSTQVSPLMQSPLSISS